MVTSTFGATSLVTVCKESVTLLVRAIEEEVSFKPLWVPYKIPCDEAHVALAGFGALGDHPDLAADHVHLLVHVPVPGEVARPAGLPDRPLVDA